MQKGSDRMARNAHRRTSHTEYVSGTAASKLQPDRRPQVRRESHTVTVRKRKEKTLSMDLPFVIMLTAASIATLFLCINYLRLQSSVTSKLKNIETLEKEIDSLKTENDALETRINTSMDLDYIYQVATEELGMVYANKDQIRLYKKTESEYVRQYENVPEW